MLNRIFALFAFLSPVAFFAMVAGATSHVTTITLSSIQHDTTAIISALAAFNLLIQALGGSYVVAAGLMLVIGFLYWVLRMRGKS